MNLFRRWVLIFFILNSASIAFTYEFQNLDEIQRALNTKSYDLAPSKKRIKVAILDKGFGDLQNEIGTSLPTDTHYFEGPLPPPPELKTTHGLAMAQIVTSIMKSPELFLYNSYGFTNFNSAIDDLIVKNVDIVLYSEVWEFGGNKDGRGFINAAVNKALDRGVTWINAAGNFELTTYVSKIETLEEDWIDLPDANHGLKIFCKPNQGLKKCSSRIVLSWNDFSDDVNTGTDKDLDLALTDDFLNVLQVSALKQTKDPDEKRPGFSSYPRESIAMELLPGTYFLRVKNRSHNFKTKDFLTVTVDGEGVSVPTHSRGQSILNPADNPRVLTIGALDSERSSQSFLLNKPDLLTLSSILTSEGEFRGSSNSAAIVAGALGLALSRNPHRSIESIVQNSTLPGWTQNLRGLPPHWLGFTAPNGRCFPAVKPMNLPTHIKDVLLLGGEWVQTSAGLRIMTPFDPIVLAPQLVRRQINDLILTTPEGFVSASRNSPYIPLDWVEIFQTPQGMGLCSQPLQPIGSIFRLPHDL